jgi:hypothetical protein
VSSAFDGSGIAPAADPDPRFRAKQNSGNAKTFDDDSSLGNSGKLNRTDSDTGTDQGSTRTNSRSGQAAFQGPIRDADEKDGSEAADKEKKSPGVPKANDEEGTNGARRGPAIISLDEKVAWRAAPVRSRMGSKPAIASARLVRLPAYPKSEWLPVDSDSKIAKK